MESLDHTDYVRLELTEQIIHVLRTTHFSLGLLQGLWSILDDAAPVVSASGDTTPISTPRMAVPRRPSLRKLVALCCYWLLVA